MSVTVEQALVAVLLADSGLAALVDEKVYPLVIPAGVDLPAVGYRLASTEFKYDMDGQAPPEIATVSFYAWADDYAEASTLGQALRTALKNQKGSVAVGEESGTLVCFLAGYADEVERIEPEGGFRYAKRLDVEAVWKPD